MQRLDPTETAFLLTLDDFPGDDLTRSAYADFLEERGDPRAEFLRRQLSIRASALGTPAWREADARLRELRRCLDSAWVERVEPLRMLGLGVRCSNVLEWCRIRSIAALCEMTAEEFLELNGFGETSLREISTKLARLGLRFRDDS